MGQAFASTEQTKKSLTFPPEVARMYYKLQRKRKRQGSCIVYWPPDGRHTDSGLFPAREEGPPAESPSRFRQFREVPMGAA